MSVRQATADDFALHKIQGGRIRHPDYVQDGTRRPEHGLQAKTRRYFRRLVKALIAPTDLIERHVAKARGQLVVPHGSSVYSHHAVITFTNTPFSEFLMTSPDCATLRPQFDPILLGEPVPERGRIHKSVLDKPGFGVELNRDCNLKRPYQH